MKKYKQLQQGFTLVELITVVGIIGVLAGISLTGFAIYRQKASLAVLNRLVADTRSDVEGSLAVGDIELPVINQYEQDTPGAIQDNQIKQVLQALVVPRDVAYVFSLDPDCQDGLCTTATIEARHRSSSIYLTTIRTGDGIWVTAEAQD